jgi:beta-lactamase class A
VATVDDMTALRATLSASTDAFAGKVGYYLRHLETGEVVAHDEQAPFPTASVIKLPLLSAFGAFVDQVSVTWDERATVTERDLAGGSGLLQYLALPHTLSFADAAWYALCLSDNVATNLFITRMGGVEAVNLLLERHVGDGMRLLSPAMVRRDSTARSMGEATAAGLGAFLERLARGRVPGAARLLDITAHQVYRNMIPRHLPEPGPATRVRRICNKTGFLPGIRADAAVVETADGTMVVAAFTDGPPWTDAHEDPGEPLIAALAAHAFKTWLDPHAAPDGHGDTPTP